MDWLSLSSAARELAARMEDASLRALALAMLAVLLIPFIRRSSSAQHTIWTLVLAGMIALPFLRPVIPATHVHLPQSNFVAAIDRSIGHSVPPPFDPPARTSLPAPPLWPLLVMAAYLGGVAFLGARLLGGVFMTRRALRNTRNVHSELWEHWELIADANVDLNLEESDSVRIPLTAGSKLTRVIFPADWRAWPRETLTAVLAHELAHARRRDPLIALAVAVNKCLFWFHPLAWWLERRLPVLAEHAADDAALAVSFDAQAYARLLLETASRLENDGNRLLWHSAAMSGPVVAQRIRRVLDVRGAERLRPLGKIGRGMVLSLGAMLIWISATVDVRTLAAGQENRLPFLPTAEQAAALEQELAANPENETVRKKLLEYYGFANMCAMGIRGGLPTPPECNAGMAETADRRIPLILWLIEHHPESDLFGAAAMLTPLDGPNVYEDARNRWLTQVSLHPNDARVLVNAAGTLNRPQEKIDLLKRARALDPTRGTEPLARVYSAILVSGKEPGLAAEVGSELQSSNDIALVGLVARQVVEGAAGAAITRAGKWDLRPLATELVTHAQALDPQNREWSDLMEGVTQLPAGPLPSVAQTAPPRVQTIRIGGRIAAANLQESPSPIYPEFAKAAGVEGTVKLQIRIGTDGHVKETTLISGDQILVNAAINAAMRYVYKPTLLNGQAAEVLTDVEIVFRETQ